MGVRKDVKERKGKTAKDRTRNEEAEIGRGGGEGWVRAGKK